jgi:hypothetical protein
VDGKVILHAPLRRFYRVIRIMPYIFAINIKSSFDCGRSRRHLPLGILGRLVVMAAGAAPLLECSFLIAHAFLCNGNFRLEKHMNKLRLIIHVLELLDSRLLARLQKF